MPQATIVRLLVLACLVVGVLVFLTWENVKKNFTPLTTEEIAVLVQQHNDETFQRDRGSLEASGFDDDYTRYLEGNARISSRIRSKTLRVSVFYNPKEISDSSTGTIMVKTSADQKWQPVTIAEYSFVIKGESNYGDFIAYLKIQPDEEGVFQGIDGQFLLDGSKIQFSFEINQSRSF